MKFPVIATSGRWPLGRLLLLVVCGLLVAATLLALGRRLGSPGRIWQDSDGPDERRARALEQQRAAVVRRTNRKAQVTRAVVAGRLSLLEAAACFRALELEPPAFDWALFRAAWPGDSDPERHCHEVLKYVRSAGGENACDLLRAELAEHLRRGTLHLPPPGKFLEALDDDAD